MLNTEQDLKESEKLETEMLLVADSTQDIYGKGEKWSDDVMNNAGFSGPWATLESTYRLPPVLIPMIQDFANRFIPHANIIFPQPPRNISQPDLLSDDRTDAGNIIFKWLNIPKFNNEKTFEGYLNQPILDFTDDVQSLELSFSDQTYLVTNHKLGIWLTNILKRKKKTFWMYLVRTGKNLEEKSFIFLKALKKLRRQQFIAIKDGSQMLCL